jgi:hypothetical protein
MNGNWVKDSVIVWEDELHVINVLKAHSDPEKDNWSSNKIGI